MPRFFQTLLPFLVVLIVSLGAEASESQTRVTLQTLPAATAETQLRALLGDSAAAQCTISIDPKLNVLSIAGPPETLDSAKTILTRLDGFKSGVEVGLLPPTTSPPAIQAPVTQSPAAQSPAAPIPVPPFAPPAVSPAVMPPSAVVYRCEAVKAATLASELQTAAQGDPQIRIVPEAKPNGTRAQLFVLAPEAFHRYIDETLVRRGDLERRLTADTSGTVLSITTLPKQVHTTTPTQSKLPVAPSEDGRDFYQPVRMTADQIVATLKPLLGQRLVMLSDEAYQYSVERDGVTHRASLRIGTNPLGFLATGDPLVTAQLTALVRMIDDNRSVQGRERRFLRIITDQQVLRRLLELNRAESATDALRRDEAIRAAATTNTARPIRQVNYLLQDELGGLSDGGAGGEVQTNGASSGSDLAVASSFNYQILDALDVVIIDATGSDVARVVDMIRRIEELSLRAQPQIDVYFLKNVHCLPLSGLIAQLYGQIGYFQMKPGTVSVIPLISPNAMLIVGWGAAKDAMRDLIETLDQPVDARDGMLKIFQLKYMSATQLYQSLQGIFPLPSPIGSAFAPRIQSWADLRTNSIVVQAGANDMAKVERLIAELDVSHGGPSLRIRHFKLNNTYVNDVAQALTEAITPGIQGTADRKLPSLEMFVVDEKGRRLLRSGIMNDVRIGRDVRNNVLMVTAPEESLELIESLVKMLDSPAATAEIKVFQMQFGNAESLVTMLQTLLPTQTAGQVGPQLPGAKEEDTLVAIRFAIDRRTNSIIAAGTAGDLKIVESLLLFIDREGISRHEQSIYKLKNLRAASVAASVSRYIASHREILRSTPGVSAYEQLDSSVIVIPEETSNSLIISATPETYSHVMKLIQDLDQSPPQVMIQVLIAEVTLGKLDEFGAEFGIQDSLLFDRSSFTNSQQGTRTITKANGDVIVEPFWSSNPQPGFGFNVDPASAIGTGFNTVSSAAAGTVLPQLLSNFATGRSSSEAGFGGMVFSANSNALSIMIRALQEKSCIEVLSRPQITAMNNQRAFIHVGQKVPVIKGSVASSNSGFAEQKIEYEDVGLLLLVTPNISPDGKVVMQVAANKSSLASNADSVVVDVKDNREIRAQKINSIMAMTVVSAADNETVVLGGLISKEHQELRRSVPYLSDIPLFGKLFQYKSNKNRRTELLVILTPRIVRSSADADRIKQIEASRMHWCLSRVIELAPDAGLYDVAAPAGVIGHGVPVVYPPPVVVELPETVAPAFAPAIPTPNSTRQ